MKNKILYTIAFVAGLVMCGLASAQNVYVTNSVTGAVTEYAPVVASVTPPSSGWLNTLKGIGTDLSSATNYSANIYGTYAPSAPKPKVQFGGGVLLIYDVSSHVGVAAGIDYLGSWSMFSGNATFKLPMEPLAGWGLTNLVMTPNAIVGLGTSMSGAGSAKGSVTTIAGLGDSLAFGHWLGGNFDVGAEAVNISGAGPYSGWDYRLFFGWTKGF
jgi:hypothetical protein